MPRYAPQDGRDFSDKVNSNRLTDELREKSGTSNSNEFRAWLQKNALAIQEKMRSDPNYNPYINKVGGSKNCK
jgi:hypothetical protein